MNRVAMKFFFSSRRRHTSFYCDWSSDVCSSDLPDLGFLLLLVVLLGGIVEQVLCFVVELRGVELVWIERELRPFGVAETIVEFALYAEPGDEQIGRASCRERVTIRLELVPIA